MRTVDLRSARSWVPAHLPGGHPPARLVVLHRDPATGASTSLVAFPEGWTRPATGHYTVAEEFTVLRGVLEMNGVRYAGGDSLHVPAYATRASSAAPVGLVAVAWFAGSPVWRWGVAPDAAVPAPCPAHSPGPDVDREVLWPRAWRWAWVPAGAPLPEDPGGPAQVRPWPRATIPEQRSIRS